MADFRDITLGVLDQLQLGTKDERAALKKCLHGYTAAQGYSVEVLSYQRGHLILAAQPAEARLLRYDLESLRRALQAELPDVHVARISIRSRPGIQPAA